MSQIDLQWFAAEDEGKTEQPTEHKLQKARKEEGRVPKSQELNSCIIFLFLILLLVLLAPRIENMLKEMMVFFFTNINVERVDDGRFAAVSLRYFLFISLPFSILGLIIGVVANLVQNKGFIYNTKLIQPKFSKLFRIDQYFKRTLFSMEGGFNVVKSLLKVVLVAFVSYLLIMAQREKLLLLLQTASPALAQREIAFMAARILIVNAVLLLCVGVLDYIVQRKQFMESMKMSKHDVKEEYKELEGDPEVKQHLENAQKELLNRNMPKAVREADVLITNPTHFAVALKWQMGVQDAPQVTAKGEDQVAFTMKRIAREAEVPIVENRPLARGLYTDSEVGDIIPITYIRAIATIYAQIGYMAKNHKTV